MASKAAAPVADATEAYERWLGKRLDIVEADLKLKHKLMQDSVFVFLRGTFYRWAALWQDTLPDFAKAPRVLAVGDLHVENFGTWRDTEGRLIWGVNDFDEVARMSYAVDLVRLVASAMFARRGGDAFLFPHRRGGKLGAPALCRHRPMQWRPGRARGEGLAAIGLGLGGRPPQGPRFCGVPGEARGAAARSLLCRQGWMGSAQARSPLRANRACPVSQASRREGDPQGHGRGDGKSASRDGRSTGRSVARSRRKPDWLREAAQAMAIATEQDWRAFRSAGEGA